MQQRLEDLEEKLSDENFVHQSNLRAITVYVENLENEITQVTALKTGGGRVGGENEFAQLVVNLRADLCLALVSLSPC